MNADGILTIVRGLKVAMSLADAVPTEAHKHEGELKWFGEVVNVHGGYDAIRDALEAARAAADAADAVAILLKLCDQLEAMKHLMVLHPSAGQNYPYLDQDNVMAYVEQARAALGKRAKREADNIKTWQERMDAGSSLHDQSILTRTDYMAEEIADLRAALRHPPVPNGGLSPMPNFDDPDMRMDVVLTNVDFFGPCPVTYDQAGKPVSLRMDGWKCYAPGAEPTQAGAEPAAAATIGAATLEGLQHAATALADAQQHIASSRDACWEHERGQWDHYQKGIDAIADLRARLASAGAGEKGGA